MAEREAGQLAPAGYVQLVTGNPNYRFLWTGEIISLFGDWFNLIASASLVASLTGSGLAVGGLFTVRMLAPFLVSPLAGVAADRYSRKNLMILSDLIRALVVLGFLLVRDSNSVPLLYILTALQLAVSGFFYPARNAILPDIVSRRELGAANALSSATWSVMLSIGAAVGGVVVGYWGIYPAFIVDALSFLLSAAIISQIRYHPHLAPGERSLRASFAQYMDGLRLFRRQPDLLAIALHKAAIQLTVNGPFQVIQVVLAEQVFVIGSGGGTSLGLMYAIAGVGTGIGPIFARRFTGDRPDLLRLVLALSYLLVTLGTLITGSLVNLLVVLLGSFLRTSGGGINWVFSTQLLQQEAPKAARGRVFSSEFALLTLANAASTALSGYVLDKLNLRLDTLILAIGLLALIPGALWALWIARRKTSYSDRL